MSSTDGELGIKNLTDKATYERLQKDVAAVKNDISALTEQIQPSTISPSGAVPRWMPPRTRPVRLKKRWRILSRSDRWRPSGSRSVLVS
jgi:hypothetical protein